MKDQQATSTSTGAVTFSISSVIQKGTYQFCVTNVTKTGWAYDSPKNVETCDTVTIP